METAFDWQVAEVTGEKYRRLPLTASQSCKARCCDIFIPTSHQTKLLPTDVFSQSIDTRS